MPAIDHISFSSLSMFLKCGEQFRRRYECGEIIPPSAFRSDTAESVEERKMTADELQAALPFQEAPDAKN